MVLALIFAWLERRERPIANLEDGFRILDAEMESDALHDIGNYGLGLDEKFIGTEIFGSLTI